MDRVVKFGVRVSFHFRILEKKEKRESFSFQTRNILSNLLSFFVSPSVHVICDMLLEF